MILLTLMFSLNLFGVFQFYLPSKFLSILSYRGKGLIEDFMNGMFMTLLATPCSAPLVGTAVGFALAGSNIDVFTIFIIMGFGLSFPLIIFLIFPSFISFIPKPGNWLNTFKKIMALMLLGTSIWLISILFKLNSDLYDTSGNLNNSQIILNWNMEEDPFLPTKLAKDGKIVFLDITADWCITCKVNKLLAVDTKDMIKFFKKNNVVIIKLDWTKPDIKISEFLSSKNRYGIPFNEVYGPSELYGILLPELLSKNIIKKYINLVK
jgi:suppressor for copper-sensitivity B